MTFCRTCRGSRFETIPRSPMAQAWRIASPAGAVQVLAVEQRRPGALEVLPEQGPALDGGKPPRYANAPARFLSRLGPALFSFGPLCGLDFRLVVLDHNHCAEELDPGLLFEHGHHAPVGSRAGRFRCNR